MELATEAVDRIMIGELIQMYGSHYDEGRMTRIVDPGSAWAIISLMLPPAEQSSGPRVLAATALASIRAPAMVNTVIV